ncbi:hypothetical protein MUP77_06990 [Candidatus Bathyarchaeota archaeon]|nr:hypothetical protein [Candidatus Bathyarchaeota archaeon]
MNSYANRLKRWWIGWCPQGILPQARALRLGHYLIPRRHLLAVSVSLALIVYLFATFIMLPQILALTPKWWTVDYINTDFILFNRPFVNVSAFPPDQREGVLERMRSLGLGNGFTLRDGETSLIRDCTLFHGGGWDPNDLAQFGYTFRTMEVGSHSYTNAGLDFAGSIVLRGSANLTLINVNIHQHGLDIRLTDRASLKMINCTNIGYGHTSQGGNAVLFTLGRVILEGNATVWLENSTIGVLVGYGDSVTVSHSVIREVRVGSRIPPRFIDSTINELYTDKGDVKLEGQTRVNYLSPTVPPLRGPDAADSARQTGRGRDIVYKTSATVDKTLYRLGEPVNVTMRIENRGLGNITLFSTNISDTVTFYLHQLVEGSSSLLLYKFYPDLSLIATPIRVAPNGTATWTLSWPQIPAVPPGDYDITCYLFSATFYFTEIHWPTVEFTLSNE